MKFEGPMLVVEDLERSRAFYCNVFGLRVISDFGANITLTGGLSLQTKETWVEFIGKRDEDISFGGNNAEMYFEETDFDAFIEKLKTFPDICYVHDVITHNWGQRGVRIYDPDRHIIEVGEDLKTVCRRFAQQGLSVEEIVERTMLQPSFVQRCLK